MIKKAGGSLKDSFLADGFILEKAISIASPKLKKNAKVLIANTQMDYDKIKIYGSKVKVDSITQMAEIENAEKQKMKNKVDKILAHNIDVFINRQLIYNYPEQLLAEKGVMVIEHADFEGIERLSNVLGGDILSTFDAPDKANLGFVELVEEIMIGEDRLISFKGCKKGEACTIVLRGASSHVLDEAERSLHDALCVIVETVKSHNTVYGGGHTEMRMAMEVDKAAETMKGKMSTCMSAFANALRQIPTIICDNAGYDSAELVANLKNEIYNGKPCAGLNMNDGTVGDMKELGIFECFRVKEQALLSACEATEMILRVDEVVTCAPRKRDRE
jgi:T-complex protein 1 subunit beta